MLSISNSDLTYLTYLTYLTHLITGHGSIILIVEDDADGLQA